MTELAKRKQTELFHVKDGPSPTGQFVTIDDDGTPTVWLHPGQRKAWESNARFVLMLAGSQGGKTSLGPWWLLREMQQRGPGNYLLVAPTFRLLAKTAVPALNYAFKTLLGLGTLVGGASGEFIISPEGHAKLWPDKPYEVTRIVFGYAENPDSLESLTAKAAWLDECGQKQFKAESHEAIQARLAVNCGRIIYTSTPYIHHWLKTEVHDRAERYREAVKENKPFNEVDADYESISFESRQNPAFPQKEWDRQKAILPPWRFDMRYRGLFTRPAGAIYDCFLPEHHIIPGKDFKPPDGWPIYCGIDFGAPNFAAIFLYEEMQEIEGPQRDGKTRLKKMGRWCAFAEYRPKESKTAAQHIEAMRKIIGRNPDLCVGGAKSEGQWRSEFQAGGWPIREPDQPDVEVGIGRVYASFAEDRLFIMDTCPQLLDEIQSYSREVDENGEPIDMTIEDQHNYHGCDSARYIVGYLNRTHTGFFFRTF